MFTGSCAGFGGFSLPNAEVNDGGGPETTEHKRRPPPLAQLIGSD
jgi:hypothetical protein